MKFLCKCGHSIHDQTDFLPYKGRLIADQDWQDLFTRIEKEPSKEFSPDWWPLLFRCIYQCAQCQRIIIEDQENNLIWFQPEDAANAKHLLSSLAGAKWKRNLRGIWNDFPVVKGAPKGVVDYSHIETDRELYSNWKAMEQAYYKIFERLKRENILRSAYLSKNGESLHTWSCD